jgi:hypothetical protein
LPPGRSASATRWREYDALIYDSDQVGGDTAPFIEEAMSMIVDRDDVADGESNGTIERIRQS